MKGLFEVERWFYINITSLRQNCQEKMRLKHVKTTTHDHKAPAKTRMNNLQFYHERRQEASVGLLGGYIVMWPFGSYNWSLSKSWKPIGRKNRSVIPFSFWKAKIYHLGAAVDQGQRLASRELSSMQYHVCKYNKFWTWLFKSLSVSSLHGNDCASKVKHSGQPCLCRVRSCICPFANCEEKLLPHVDSLVVLRRQYLKVDQKHY